MNLTKKILSVILSVILAIAVFGVCASAEGVANGDESMTVTVSTDKDVYAPGDEITVTVSLKTNFNMTAFRFPILFNADVFEIPNLIGLTALNTTKAKGTIISNSLADISKVVDGYNASEFNCVLVQWTASVSGATLGCLNLPDGEESFSFKVKAKSSAAGKEGTFFIPEEYKGIYNQGIQTPTDATTIYYIDNDKFTKNFVRKTVSVVGETVDLVPNAAYDSEAVIDKDRMLVYGFEMGMETNAELKQKVIATGSGTIKTVYTDLGLGTGALINVVDGGTVVKTYTVVIFGDVNGDAIIDTNDLFIVEMVANGMGDFETTACEFAADLNGDEVIDTMDTAVEEMAANSLIDINQVSPMDSF